MARFAATHAGWTRPRIQIEDLLISVADKVWKNKRAPDLEDLVVSRLAEASGRSAEEFLAFDDLLTSIGEDADGRLAFQAACPCFHRPSSCAFHDWRQGRMSAALANIELDARSPAVTRLAGWRTATTPQAATLLR